MNPPETLAQWLSYLEQLHPKGIDLGLERVAAVAAKLSVLSFDATVITIAGTNGKGSTIAMLEAGLSALNVRSGSYTSPHILQFNERITIAGETVASEQVVAAFEQIEAARGEISLSYFEYTTLAALICFQQSSLDIILLEVGLGGRLDAVNIVDADIAIITSIALDHQDWLGDSVDQIALEKLGVARPNKPLLIADQTPVEGLRSGAIASQAKCLWINTDFSLRETESEAELVLVGGRKFRCDRPQHLSQESFAVAAQALDLLGFHLDQAVLAAMVSADLIGRFNVIQYQSRELVFDVAHNPAAISRLCARVGRQFPNKTINLWLGVMADKNVSAIVAELSSCVNGQWFVAALNTPRALCAQDLVEQLNRQLGIAASPSEFSSVVDTINTDEVLLICGSFYTVAAGMQSLQNEGLIQ